MAYTYKSAMGRGKRLDDLWQAVDIAEMDIHAIFDQYRDVYLTLRHPAVTQDIYLRMESIRSKLVNYTGTKTLIQWLASNGNSALPALQRLPDFKRRVMRYRDATRAGYKIRPVDIGRHVDSQVPDSEKRDLLMSKPGVDMRTWWQFCLVTVNGMFHRVGGSEEGLYVVRGAESIQLANRNDVGIYSMRDVGAMTTIPITPEMVYKQHPSQRMANFVNIALPQSITGKTVLLVIGGYLHLLDNTYRVTGDRSIQINFNNFRLAERIYQSKQLINLDGLKLDHSRNLDQHSVADLTSDKTIRNYLTLSQSFVIVVNAKDMFLQKHPLERSGLPGRHYHHEAAPLPMFGPLGRTYDYLYMEEWGKQVVASRPLLNPQFNFNTTEWRGENSIDNTQYSARPHRDATGYLVEFGRFS